MTDTVDQKIQTLYSLYKDSSNVVTVQNDVESIRKHANQLGLAATIAVFGLNEVARLTLRSRKSRIVWSSLTCV